MINTRSTLIVIFLYLFGSLCSADSTKFVISDSLPKILHNSKNGSIQIAFSDENVAELVANKAEKKPFRYNAEITENTCAQNFKRQMCEYSLDVIPEVISLRWVKHKDSKKIGDLVVLSDDVEVYSSNTILHIWESKFSRGLFELTQTPLSQNRINMLSNAKLTCPDVSWLKAFEKNGRVSIDEWASETNAQNPDTDLAENLIVSTYMDVETKVNFEENYLEFIDVGFTPPLRERDSFSSFSFGDVLGMSLRKKDSSMCEVSIKADSQSFLNFLISLFDSPDKLEYELITGLIKNKKDLLSYTDDEFQFNFSDQMRSALLDSNLNDDTKQNIEILARMNLVGISEAGSNDIETNEYIRTYTISTQEVQ